jgi:protein-tyrosine phosphatase
MNLKNLIDKYSKIIDNLYIGNHESPIDQVFLKEKNIKLIINCTKGYTYEVPEYIQMIRLCITDFNSPENNIILAYSVDKILEIMNIYLDGNEGILVHCHMGQQRSAMIVVCYLMKFLKINLYDSIKEVKNKRKFSFLPEITFEDFLKYYEDVLKN